MTDYKPGDKVDSGVGGPLTVMAVAGDHAWVRTDEGEDYVEPLSELDPWPTKPRIELPTEPGHYLDRDGDYWTLDDMNYEQTRPAEFAPFTRLVPEGSEREAAIREVIHWMQGNHWPFEPSVVIEDIRNHFRIAE